MSTAIEKLVAAEVAADHRFCRQVERLHRLGPRAVGSLLAEIGAERSITTIIERKLETYVELDPAALEVTAGLHHCGRSCYEH